MAEADVIDVIVASRRSHLLCKAAFGAAASMERVFTLRLCHCAGVHVGHVSTQSDSYGGAVHSIKRLIGRDFDEVADLAARLPYSVVPDTDGRAVVDVPSHGRVTPEEASADILKVCNMGALLCRTPSPHSAPTLHKFVIKNV